MQRSWMDPWSYLQMRPLVSGSGSLLQAGVYPQCANKPVQKEHKFVPNWYKVWMKWAGRLCLQPKATVSLQMNWIELNSYKWCWNQDGRWSARQGETLEGFEAGAHHRVIQHLNWNSILFYALPYYQPFGCSLTTKSKPRADVKTDTTHINQLCGH